MIYYVLVVYMLSEFSGHSVSEVPNVTRSCLEFKVTLPGTFL